MWNSVPLLQSIANVCLIVTLVAGIIAAAAGAIGTLSGNRATDIQKRESDERVAQANRAAAEANAQAERARADAAKANQRAQEAKAEAAKSHERLQKAQEMRQLTKPQAEALMPLLKSDFFQKEPRPRLNVSHVAGAEAESFGLQLVSLFKACGVRQGHFGEAYQTVPSKTDLALALRSFEPTQQNQPFAHLQHSLQAVGWTVGTITDPTVKDNEARLIVLRKPPV